MHFTSLTPDEKLSLWACLALRHCPGIGAFTAKCLVDHYGNAHEAVAMERRLPGCWLEEKLVNRRVAGAFASEKWRDKATAEWQGLQKEGTSFVFLHGPGYPQLLASTDDAPLILYCQGNERLLQGAMVGIVGSRDCTEEGIRVTAFFARALSAAGVTIVSGMARGIDRAAHIAALREVGSSIAVLGTGVDVVYPQDNGDLHAIIAKEGLLVSEFPPGTPPQPQNFPVRNRIISGLSRGVLVAEASRRSGSLITARLALEQGRDVFAVPGHTLSLMSEGCRSLIRQGAKPVFGARDILEDLGEALQSDARMAVMASIPFADDGKEAVPPWDSLHLPVEREGKSSLPPLCLPEQAGKNPCLEPVLVADRGKHRKTGPVAGPGRTRPEKRAVLPGARKKKGHDAPSGAKDALSAEDQAIVAALQGREVHIDTLCLELGRGVAQVSAALVVLEMQGIVRRAPGMRYSLP